MINPKRGDVYLVNFDPTLGAEIRKTRPALVLQNDIANRHSPITIVAAITSHFGDRLYPTEVLVEAPVSRRKLVGKFYWRFVVDRDGCGFFGGSLNGRFVILRRARRVRVQCDESITTAYQNVRRACFVARYDDHPAGRPRPVYQRKEIAV